MNISVSTSNAATVDMQSNQVPISSGQHKASLRPAQETMPAVKHFTLRKDGALAAVCCCCCKRGHLIASLRILLVQVLFREFRVSLTHTHTHTHSDTHTDTHTHTHTLTHTQSHTHTHTRTHTHTHTHTHTLQWRWFYFFSPFLF